VPSLLEKAAKLDLEWNSPYFLMVLEAFGHSRASNLLGKVQALAPEIVAWEYKDSVVAMVYALPETAGRAIPAETWFNSIETSLRQDRPGANLVMGLANPSVSMSGLKNSYEQARQAAWFGKVLDEGRSTFVILKIWDFQLLTPIWDSNLEGYARQNLKPLLEMKDPKRQEYLETLEALLTEETQKEAAERLFVHEKRFNSENKKSSGIGLFA